MKTFIFAMFVLGIYEAIRSIMNEVYWKARKLYYNKKYGDRAVTIESKDYHLFIGVLSSMLSKECRMAYKYESFAGTHRAIIILPDDFYKKQ